MTTPSFALRRTTAAESCENTVPVRAECGLTTLTAQFISRLGVPRSTH